MRSLCGMVDPMRSLWGMVDPMRSSVRNGRSNQVLVGNGRSNEGLVGYDRSNEGNLGVIQNVKYSLKLPDLRGVSESDTTKEVGTVFSLPELPWYTSVSPGYPH